MLSPIAQGCLGGVRGIFERVAAAALLTLQLRIGFAISWGS